MDNIVDRAVYPLPQQEEEAKNKRRMGLGVTGVANALEIMGYPYASYGFMTKLEEILTFMRNNVYAASINLAAEKGPFPLFEADKYLDSDFARTLPDYLQDSIRTIGIRNSHLLSIAPTGTISLSADNVSSGIEPVFSHYYDRTINLPGETRVERVEDYAYRVHGIKGVTANELRVEDHVKVLNLASRYVDSACSKTCNVGDDVTWEEFKDVYMQAYDGGASGCTTFRASGKRAGILSASKDEEVVEEKPQEVDTFVDEVSGACTWDPVTGIRSCE